MTEDTPQSNPEDVELDLAIVTPAARDSSMYDDKVKFVCCGLDNFPKDKSFSTLHDIYIHLKNNCFAKDIEAFLFLYQVLEMIDYSPMTPLPASLSADHNIESYSARKRYSNVNLRITALELINSLSEQEKKILTEFLHKKNSVPLDEIKSEPILAKALFSEGVVTASIHLHSIAKCFNRGNLTASLVADCNNDSERGGVKELDVTPLKKEVTRDRKQKYWKYCRRVVFSLYCLISIALLIYLTNSLVQKNHSYSGHYNITDNSTVILETNGFSSDVDDIKLTLISNDYDADITVYQWAGTSTDLNSHTTKTEKLSRHVVDPLYTGFFKRQPLNYNGGDNPVYGVTGTLLQFHLLAWSSFATPSCLKIRVFRDRAFYDEAVLKNGETNLTIVNGVVDHSPCLSVGKSLDTPNNATWSYTFNETGYVYVSFDQGDDTHIIGGYISGIAKLFDIHKLTHACSGSITIDVQNCPVSICGHGTLCLQTIKGSHRDYVFLKSNGVSKSKLYYKVAKAVLSLKEFILILVTGVFLIIVVLSIVYRFSLTICKPMKSLCTVLNKWRRNRSQAADNRPYTLLTQVSNEGDNDVND